MVFGAELLPLSGTDLSLTAIIGTVALWVKGIIDNWSTRNNTRLAATIAKEERADKAAQDSRITLLEQEAKNSKTLHGACEEARLRDKAAHDLAASERAHAVQETQRRIEELEELVGLRKKPRVPKSGPVPRLPSAPEPSSFPQRDQTT